MDTVIIRIERAGVFDEVAKISDYVGSKLIDQEGAEGMRDKLLMTDEAQEDLIRFWEESIIASNDYLKEMLIYGDLKNFNDYETDLEEDKDQGFVRMLSDKEAEAKVEPGYELKLEVSNYYNRALTSYVGKAIRSFLINFIVGKWFNIINKDLASDYFNQAIVHIENAKTMLYDRMRPTSPLNN